jgi:hypothetical protein
MILKMPLYLFMRCAENQRDFFLNRFEYFLISRICVNRFLNEISI